MGQLDRDWYKEHHQQKTSQKSGQQSRQRTLDNDPREIDLPEQSPDMPKFTLLHFIVLSVCLFSLMIWYFVSK